MNGLNFSTSHSVSRGAAKPSFIKLASCKSLSCSRGATKVSFPLPNHGFYRSGHKLVIFGASVLQNAALQLLDLAFCCSICQITGEYSEA